MRSFVIGVILLVTQATAAPVPKAKAQKAFDLVPSTYLIYYNDQEKYPTEVILEADGNYQWGETWTGSYGWDKSTRVLLVLESSSGSDWLNWSVTIDSKGISSKVTRLDSNKETSWSPNCLIFKLKGK